MDLSAFNSWAASCVSKTAPGTTPATRLDRLLAMATDWCERHGAILDLGKIQFSRALQGLGFSKAEVKGRTVFRDVVVDDEAAPSAPIEGPGSDRLLSTSEAAIWLAGRWRSSVNTFDRLRRWITHGYQRRADGEFVKLPAAGSNSCAIKLGDLERFVAAIEGDLRNCGQEIER